MKRILFFLLLLINIGVFGQTTYYWVGGNTITGNFSFVSNWNSVKGSTAVGTRPTATIAANTNPNDNFVFDYTDVGGGVTGTSIIISGGFGAYTLGGIQVVGGNNFSVRINQGGAVILNNNLIVNAGNTLEFVTATFTFGGSFSPTLNGTLVFGAQSSTTPAFPIGTDWTANSATGTIAYNYSYPQGNCRIIPATYYNLDADYGTGVNRNFGTVNTSQQSFVIKGNFYYTANSSSVQTSVFTFNGGDQIIAPTNFYGLVIGGTGVKTISRTGSTGNTINTLAISTTATNSVAGFGLTVSSGAVLDLGDFVLTGTVISNSGEIRTASAASLPTPGSLPWGGLVTYNGTATQSIPATSFTDLKITGAKSSNVSFTGSYTSGSSILTNLSSVTGLMGLPSATTITGPAGIGAASATTNTISSVTRGAAIKGNLTSGQAYIATMNTVGLVAGMTLSGTGINSGTTINSVNTPVNLSGNGSSTGVTSNGTNQLTATSTTGIAIGMYVVGAGNGNIPTGKSVTVTAFTASTITLSQTIPSGVSFAGISFSGLVTMSATATASNNDVTVTCSPIITMASAASATANSQTVTLPTTLILSSGTTNIAGSMSVDFTGTYGSTVNTGSTFIFNSTTAQTIPPLNFNNLTISGTRTSNNVTLSSTGSIGIAGTFSNTASFSGGGGYVNTGSTVNFNGTGSQTIPVFNYNNLTISGARSGSPMITWGSGTINVAGALNVNYTGTVTFTTTGSTVNLTGSVSSTLSSATSFQILSVGTNATLITSVATTINGSAAINGTFQLNSGGSISAAPTYGSASHLIYNTTYGTFNEWTGGASASVAAGSGVPANVTVQSGTVTLGGGRGIPGNLTVNSGCGFVLNATSGDLYIGGNLTNNGSTWTNNTRAVFFVGTGTSVVTAGSGTQFFDYLIIAKSSGSVQVHSSTNITINTTSGDVLQFTNAGTLDLNGRTLTLNNSGGNISVNGATGGTAKSITSSTAANIAITNSKTVVNASSGTLSIGANITVTLTGGFNCGSSLTTINGTLRINSGGFINTNAPIYGANSTLQYNSGTTYGRSTEWTATTGTVGTTVALPASVQISNNTTLNYPNGSSSPARTLSGNLTIDAGSSLYMDFGSPSSTGALTVGGNVTVNGNLSLGNQNGGDIYVGGNWSHGAGTFAANNRAVFFNGANAQTITNTNGTNESFPFLIINNTNGGVSLNSPVTVTNTLTITSGILTTTTTNLLSVTNTANTAVVATTSFSATRFINGPLAWTLPASTSNTYIFPVGAGSSYYPLSLASPTTSTAGTTVVRVQSVISNSGGSADGTTLASISPNEYWSITASVGNVTGGTISLTRTSISIGSFNAIGASTTLAGTYVSIGGTASGSSINTSNSISTINAGSTGFYVLGIIASADPSITTITGGLTGTSGYIGQTLTINGLNFTSGATVTFNGGSAIATTFVDATQLTVVVPASATTGNIVVTSNSVQTAPYSYTILGYITTQAGDWNTNTTWLGGAIPPINTNTTIDHAVTINAAVADPATSITINASRSLTFGASGSITATTITNNGTISMASGGTITVAASGTLANNATFTHGAGTIVLTNGTSTFTGITQLNNITINAGYNFSGITVNGILQLNAGAFVNTTAPTYATGSTLRYNTGGTYGRTTEWTATSGVGYPHHVQISNNTILDIGANSGGATARQIGGNLTIDAGSTLTMAGGTSATGSQAMSTALTVLGSVINNGTLTLSGTIGGDIYVANNWTNTGTFNTNSRAVFFNGSSNSTINSATTFSFLLINKTGGASVTLGAATTVSNDLTISSGAVLDVSTSNFALNIGGNFSNSGTFTARNGTVTFNGSGTQTLSGSTTFYNLTETNAGTTLQLTAGTTQTIGNILTITGAAGNLVTLTSTTASPAFLTFTTPNNTNISFASISNITNNSTAITVANSTNGGNNTNITFGAIRWVGGSSGNWATAANWSRGTVLNTNDAVLFDNSVPANANPTVTLTANTTLSSITFDNSNVGFTGSTTQTTNSSGITIGNTTVTLSAPNASIFIGQTVTYSVSSILAANTTVAAISGTTLTLSTPPTATSSGVGTLTFSASITTTSMTVTSSQVTFVDNLTINSSLTFSGANSRVTNNAFTNGRAITLGNGNAFTLEGNSSSNYFDGNTNAYYAFNTTSALTVFFNPATTFGGIQPTRGIITLGGNVNTQRLLFGTNLPNNFSQGLILNGNTFTLSGGVTNSLNATSNCQGIDASATGSRVVITSTAPTILNTANGNILFKPSFPVENLELNSSGNTFNAPQAVTIRNLTLTNGTYNNTTNNITILDGGSITRANTTATLSAAPIFGTNSAHRVNINITATSTSGNELLGTTGGVGTLTISSGTYSLATALSTTVNTLVVGTGGAATLQYANSSGAVTTLNVTSTVTIGDGATFQCGSQSNALSGVVHVLNVGGNINIGNGSTFNMTNNSTRYVALTLNSSSAGDQTISSSGTPTLVTFGTIILNRGNSTHKVVCSVTANTVPSGQMITYTNGTWEQSAGTLTFSTSSTQTIPSTGGLIISGSGSFSQLGSLTVSGVFTLNTSGTFNMGAGNNALTITSSGAITTLTSGTLNINGRLVCQSSGNLNINGATVNFPPGGTIDNGSNSIFRVTTGAASFAFSSGALNVRSKNANQTLADILIQTGSITGGTITVSDVDVSVNIDRSIFNFTIENGGGSATARLVNSLQVSNQLMLTSGVLNIGSNTLTLNGTASGSGFIRGSSTSNLTIGGTGSFGTINFDATTPGTTNVLQNLTINRTSTGSVTLGSNLTVAGATTLTDGVFDIGSNTLTLNGTVARTNGTVTATSGTVTFNGSSAQSVPASIFTSNTLNNLNISNTNGVTFNGSNAITGTMTVNGLFTPVSSAVISGAGTLTGTGTVQVTGATGTADLSNQYTLNRTLTDLTVEYIGAAAQGVNGITFGGLKISNTNGVNMTGTVTVNGALNLNTGYLSISNNTLTLNGTATGSGFLRGGNTSNLTIGGAGALGTLNFDATKPDTTNVLRDFTVNRSGGSVTIGNALNITRILQPTAGTLNTGGFITLKSTSITNTAIVGQVGVGGTISGNVTAERFIPQNPSRNSSTGIRAYRDISPGLLPSSNIFTQWQENGTNNNGYGTQITGQVGTVGQTDATTGMDYTVSGAASLFSYNVNTGTGIPTWDSGIRNTKTTTASPFKGYRIAIRGNRANNLAVNIPGLNAPATLRNTGTLITGEVSFTTTGVTANGSTNNNIQLARSTASDYTLVANPYWCPIDWVRISGRANNLTDFYWVWDPNIGTSGGYVTHDGTTSSNVAAATSRYIQPGQAFFVQNTSTNPSFTIRESDKAVSQDSLTAVFSESPQEVMHRLNFVLYRNINNVLTNMDGAVIRYKNGFSAGRGREDAAKFDNASDNIAITNQNIYSIEGRPVPTTSDSVRLRLWATTNNGIYQLQIDASGFNYDQVQPYLKDRFTNSQVLLQKGQLNVYNFTTTADTNSYNHRFTVVYSSNNVTPLPVQFIQVKASAVQTGVHNISFTTQSSESKRYEVEYASNTSNGQFTSIGTITSKGDGLQSYSYTHTISNATTGIYYYRIKSIDVQGKEQYSAVVRVQSVDNNSKEQVIRIYPNPVLQRQMQVHVGASVSNQPLKVQVYDQSGKLVFSSMLQHNNAGSNSSYRIGLPTMMASGKYHVEITGKGETERWSQSIIVSTE